MVMSRLPAGGLWTLSIWLSAGLFLPLPGPGDFILQRFSNKIIHTVLHMLLSHQHHHPTQTWSQTVFPLEACEALTTFSNPGLDFLSLPQRRVRVTLNLFSLSKACHNWRGSRVQNLYAVSGSRYPKRPLKKHNKIKGTNLTFII